MTEINSTVTAIHVTSSDSGLSNFVLVPDNKSYWRIFGDRGNGVELCMEDRFALTSREGSFM